MDQILPWEEDAVASGVLILLGLLDAGLVLLLQS